MQPGRSPWSIQMPCAKCGYMLYASMQPDFEGELHIVGGWRHTIVQRHRGIPTLYVIQEEPGRDG